VGNSSSGLCEAPSFRKPTLNIGNRQKGRARGNTVIDCEATYESISQGLQQVLSPIVRQSVAATGVNPYAKEGTLEAILQRLVETPLSKQAVKSFYDL
jgi:UDP-N-acetylglucosamine 2-epimerase